MGAIPIDIWVDTRLSSEDTGEQTVQWPLAGEAGRSAMPPVGTGQTVANISGGVPQEPIRGNTSVIPVGYRKCCCSLSIKLLSEKDLVRYRYYYNIKPKESAVYTVKNLYKYNK